jgi:hypothetical protein
MGQMGDLIGAQGARRAPTVPDNSLYDKHVDQIEIDEIAEVNFTGEDASQAEVRFKDGSVKTYNGEEHPEVFALLNHWTAPTA